MSVCPVHPRNRENYIYSRNEPKNEADYKLEPKIEPYVYERNEPKNQKEMRLVSNRSEFYSYGYPYAMYKKKTDNSVAEEKKFSGVF